VLIAFAARTDRERGDEQAHGEPDPRQDGQSDDLDPADVRIKDGSGEAGDKPLRRTRT
jgi:hypothetical protein